MIVDLEKSKCFYLLNQYYTKLGSLINLLFLR
jgi:hypothetical protein